MRFFKIIIAAYFFISCSKTTQNEQLLEGYWEIKKVETATGTKKEYTLNTTIDYFKVDGLKGYRKKMQPTFNNTFITSNNIEPFTISKNKAIVLHYKNNLSEWKETIEILTQNELVLVNQENNRYFYTRFTPINTSTQK